MAECSIVMITCLFLYSVFHKVFNCPSLFFFFIISHDFFQNSHTTWSMKTSFSRRFPVPATPPASKPTALQACGAVIAETACTAILGERLFLNLFVPNIFPHAPASFKDRIPGK